MIVALRGSDTFLAGQTIVQIKEKYLSKNAASADVVEYDGREPVSDFVDLTTFPLFATSRLVIVRYAASLDSERRQELARQLGRLPTTVVAVVWDGGKLPVADALALLLAGADKSINTDPIAPSLLAGWLVKTAEKQGDAIDRPTAEALIAEYGNDLWALTTALPTLGKDGQPAPGSNRVRPASAPPFIYFRLVRQQAWPKLAGELRRSYRRGEPIEMVIGSLAAALRQLPANLARRQELTAMLADLDFGLKTGLVDGESAYALLIGGFHRARPSTATNHLPNSRSASVQWETVWQEVAS